MGATEPGVLNRAVMPNTSVIWNTASQDYQEACLGPDAGTQRVTILAEWRGHERQAQIVKRNR